MKFSPTLKNGIRRAWLLAFFIAGIFPASLIAQPLGELYQSPPPHSAFVRILNATKTKITTHLSPTKERSPTTLDPGLATSFFLVKKPMVIGVEVNGRVIASKILVRENRFATLVITAVQNAYRVKLIEETASDLKGLKAELRFYNLIDGCTAEVKIAKGAAVFKGVLPYEVHRRDINPVAADLRASCSENTAAEIQLPPLEPGVHFSLFFFGENGAPFLSGQKDRTHFDDR